MWHLRTFHVEIFFILDTLAKSFYKSRNYAPFKNFSRSKVWKCDYGTLLITRRCNRRKIQDIDNNLTSTHLPRRDFFLLETPPKSVKKGRNTRDVIWKRAKPCICWLKTQLCHIATRKTRQWKTPTMYTQQLHIHALSKLKYLSRVVYGRGKLRVRETCTSW